MFKGNSYCMATGYEQFNESYRELTRIFYGRHRNFREAWYDNLIAQEVDPLALVAAIQRAESTVNRMIELEPAFGERPLNEVVESKVHMSIPVAKNHTQFRNIPKRLEQLLETLKKVATKEEEEFGRPYASDILTSEKAIQRHFHRILDSPSWEEMARLGRERESWAFLPNNEYMKYLPIDQFFLVRLCKLQCDFCGVDAPERGRMLDWDDFIQTLTTVEKYFVEDEVFLGETEPLIYSSRDRHMGEVVRELVMRGVNLNLTTAGLVPCNAKQGREALESLQDLKDFLSTSLTVAFTFSLLNPVPKEEYIECMAETLTLFAALTPYKFQATLLYSMFDSAETQNAFYKACELASKKVSLPKSFTESPETKPVGPLGRAADGDYVFGPDAYAMNCRFLGYGKAHNTYPRFAIGPGGLVFPSCVGFGESGTIVGNVYRNDVLQLRRNFWRFVEDLPKYLAQVDRGPGNMHRCELHRRWKKVYRPKRSYKPFLQRQPRRRAACG